MTAERANTESHDLGRRTFLRRAAIGGAVAWTAPVLLSSPAAAQGSCLSTQVHNWIPGDVPSGSQFVIDQTTTMTLTLVGGVTLTSTVDTLFDRSTVGGTADNYHLQLFGSQPGPEILTLTFSPAVTDLTFNVLDIDRSATEWIDRVRVEAALGANPVSLVGTQLGNGNVYDPVNDWYTGSAAVANAGTVEADVNFVIPGPVDTVTITYMRAGTLTSQGIGLSSLGWCTT
jgi:hypothetical protein